MIRGNYNMKKGIGIELEELLVLMRKLIEQRDNKKAPFVLLTQKELLEYLDISPNTLKNWEKIGLKRLEPHIEGTRTVYYQLKDVIEFMTN